MPEGPSLSREEAIAIQADQLAEWKLLLNPTAYRYLEHWARSTNDTAQPFQIRRGLELTRRVEGMALSLGINCMAAYLDSMGKAVR